MTIPGVAVAKRVFVRLPGPAQLFLRGVVRRHARKERRESAALLNVVCGGFAGKRVLEVGSDANGFLAYEVVTGFGAAECVGVNPLFSRVILPNCRLESVDVRQMPYPDASFDLIVSLSAFEHIQDLDRGLAEMHRVLAPGGLLFSQFGPIWSTSYGHHLGFRHGGRTYTYWNTVLPSYAHLLLSREELVAVLRKEHDDAAATAIADYVLGSDEQNQLFFEDYKSLVEASAFETVFFKGYDVPALAARYACADYPGTLARLRERYPGRQEFMYDGIALMLRKSG